MCTPGQRSRALARADVVNGTPLISAKGRADVGSGARRAIHVIETVLSGSRSNMSWQGPGRRQMLYSWGPAQTHAPCWLAIITASPTSNANACWALPCFSDSVSRFLSHSVSKFIHSMISLRSVRTCGVLRRAQSQRDSRPSRRPRHAVPKKRIDNIDFQTSAVLRGPPM